MIKFQKGFTLVEVLIASVIVSVSVLGLSTSLVGLGHSRKKSVAVSNSIAIENALVAAITDINSYEEGNTDAKAKELQRTLAQGSLPQSLTLKLKFNNITVDVALTSSSPAVTLFDENLNLCFGGFSKVCPYKLTLQSRSGANRQYEVIYQIEVHQDLAVVQPSGTAKNPDGTYKDPLAIPVELYKPGFKNACDKDETSAIGMDPVTGEVNCIKKPDLKNPDQYCPEETIPK